MKQYTVFADIENWRNKTSLGEFSQEQIIQMVQANEIGMNAYIVEHGFFDTVTELCKLPWLAEHWPATSTEPTGRVAFSLPQVESEGESSVVPAALTVFAMLEFVGAVLGPLAFISTNAFLSLLILVSGVLSGLILLGFAAVIKHTRESTQRLRRIGMLIQKVCDSKKDN